MTSPEVTDESAKPRRYAVLEERAFARDYQLPRHDYQPWRCKARRSSYSVITRVQVQTVWSLTGTRRDLVFSFLLTGGSVTTTSLLPLREEAGK
jgi:hypothetical protein